MRPGAKSLRNLLYCILEVNMARKSSVKAQVVNAPDPKFEPMFPTEVDLDAVSDRVTNDMVEKLAGQSRGNKPDISGLPDALREGRPLFRVGDRIVIEQYCTVLDTNPYLHTRTYKVEAINPTTGDLKLWDESVNHWAMDNYVTGPKYGQVYKFAAGATVGKRKRGRPRKNPIAPVVPKETADAAPKKRGRPKGSKNRPKDVVAAEKRARVDARKAKKAAVGRKRATSGSSKVRATSTPKRGR